MAIAAKTSYPKAIPCHSAEELAMQNSRLNQANDELLGQARRLKESNEALAERAVRLRRWTLRMAGAFVVLLLLVAGGVALAFQYPNLLVPASVASPEPGSAAVEPKEIKDVTPIAIVKTNGSNEPIDTRKAQLTLPATALAKPGAASSVKAGFLEALGGLSAAHLYQTHLNIGLLADGVESETYTVEEAEKNLKAVVDLMKMVDVQLNNVTKTGIDKEEQEAIREIQAIAGLLNLQVASLRAYWANGDLEQAAQYHKARKATGEAVAKVMGIE